MSMLNDCRQPSSGGQEFISWERLSEGRQPGEPTQSVSHFERRIRIYAANEEADCIAIDITDIATMISALSRRADAEKKKKRVPGRAGYAD